MGTERLVICLPITFSYICFELSQKVSNSHRDLKEHGGNGHRHRYLKHTLVTSQSLGTEVWMQCGLGPVLAFFNCQLATAYKEPARKAPVECFLRSAWPVDMTVGHCLDW